MTGWLQDRGVIAVSGPEAKTFLQGLITNDASKLQRDAPLYAALLTPQGKVLFDFILSEGDGAILLDVAAASAAPLLKRLTMYRLRAKVEIAQRNDLGVFWGEGGLPDPRLVQLGHRHIGATDQRQASADYLAHRLTLGVPEGTDFGSDKMFALDAGMEELHGVSFEKGCYVGQELTARMKHRGTARKRLLPVSTVDGSPLALTSEVRAGDIALGEITSTYGTRGFALIRQDRWQEASAAAPRVGDTEIRIDKPAWLVNAAGT